MNAATLKEWFQQVSTAIGGIISLPTVIALLSHQITLQQAIPPIVAAIAAALWPENKALPAQAQTAAQTVETFVPQLAAVYNTGLAHGAAGVTNAPAPAPAPQAVPA